MKTRTLLLAATALSALTATANAQISLSDHNFSSYGWANNQICKPCHTPHNSNEAVGRLWNHSLTTATYQMHKGTGTAEVNIDSSSRLCLSCHDGTVALDSFGGATTGGTSFIPGTKSVGTNLNNDHPIGSDAIYPTSGTSYNPQTVSSTGTSSSVTFNGNTVRLRAWVDSTGATKFVVGCGSCHSAHNSGNRGHMLTVNNTGSALCLTCHIK
jgi:predicted CXXCH cytochrome family protein